MPYILVYTYITRKGFESPHPKPIQYETYIEYPNDMSPEIEELVLRKSGHQLSSIQVGLLSTTGISPVEILNFLEKDLGCKVVSESSSSFKRDGVSTIYLQRNWTLHK